jgi:PPOX class probable F420-dependent enzyme
VSRELTDRDTAVFAEGRNVGHFATLLADGSPHVTPMWIDARDGLVWINSAEGRVKVENVRRDPRVAISVPYLDDPYRRVVVRGRVVEVTHEGAAEHIDDLSERYNGVRPFPEHNAHFPRVLIKIQPEHVTHFDE